MLEQDTRHAYAFECGSCTFFCLGELRCYRLPSHPVEALPERCYQVEPGPHKQHCQHLKSAEVLVGYSCPNTKQQGFISICSCCSCVSALWRWQDIKLVSTTTTYYHKPSIKWGFSCLGGRERTLFVCAFRIPFWGAWEVIAFWAFQSIS
jgi:hypothetical protein